jgi:four helix bundle protein
LHVYRDAAVLPPSENFGLLLQLRRSAAGIATRVAAGSGRGLKAESVADLDRARSSAYELEYLLLLSHDLGYLSDDVHAALTAETIEVRRIVSGLIRTVTTSL